MPDMAAERASVRADRALAALAEDQHGVVSRAQLVELGLSRHAIDTRVVAGRLHRMHRGVYAVGHRLLGAKGRWLAAVFAIGRNALLSHRSAAALWDLLPTSRSTIEVSVARHVRQRSGIRVYCVGPFEPDEIDTKHGVPCTSVARTLVDLAAVLPERRLEQALGQAEVLRLYDRRALELALGRHRRCPGAATLRRLLERDDPAVYLTRSALEERLLVVCDVAGIPRPEMNVPFLLPDGTAIVIDALWRGARLAVELDGRRFHAVASAYVRDRRRDAQLTLAGLRPVRLSHADLVGDVSATGQLLRGLLAVS